MDDPLLLHDQLSNTITASIICNRTGAGFDVFERHRNNHNNLQQHIISSDNDDNVIDRDSCNNDLARTDIDCVRGIESQENENFQDDDDVVLRQRRRSKCNGPSQALPAHCEISSRSSDRNRILDRDGAFFQSRGRWRVQYASRNAAAEYLYDHDEEEEEEDDDSNTRHGRTHDHQDANNGANQCNRRIMSSSWRRWRICRGGKRFWDSWFYNLAYQRTAVLMLIIFTIYMVIVLIFAMIYLALSHFGRRHSIDPSDGSTTVQYFCDMDITNHLEALYFSLSTMATIGYGVSDYFFGGCWTPFVLVLSQVCCAITFNAIAASILFLRISRGHKRVKTILFSNHAVIQKVNGTRYLMFRVAELRRHPLFEASVRAYCIRTERQPMLRTAHADECSNNNNMTNIHTTHFVTKPVPLQHEETSSTTHILMSLPQVLVHRLDEKSPLMPSSCTRIGDHTKCWYDRNGTAHRLRQKQQRDDNIQTFDCTNDRFAPCDDDGDDDDIKKFIQDRDLELIILLEGTDELTGAAIQARHSYTYNDIQWDHCFVPCVLPYEHTMANNNNNNSNSLHSNRNHPVCIIDFARFHNTEFVSSAVTSCPYVDNGY